MVANSPMVNMTSAEVGRLDTVSGSSRPRGPGGARRVAVMTLAIDERAAICDEFAAVGPERPTLCAGWNTRDLLIHLLVRERQPWVAPGIVIPALSPIVDRAAAGYAGTPWSEMIAQLRGGPPPWSPFRVGKLDEFGNGAEFFIHHEDVRRGVAGWSPAAGRAHPGRPAVGPAAPGWAACSTAAARSGWCCAGRPGSSTWSRPGRVWSRSVGEPGEIAAARVRAGRGGGRAGRGPGRRRRAGRGHPRGCDEFPAGPAATVRPPADERYRHGP